MKDEDITWITVKGQHIPIHEGESKREAVSKAISKFKKKKQSNNKIDRFEKRGNTYIPVRKGEDEKEVVRNYKESESPEKKKRIKQAQDDEQKRQMGIHLNLGKEEEEEVKEAQKRKGTLVDYEKRLKETFIDRNDEFDKIVDDKIRKGEELTREEYLRYVSREPKEGDIILAGGRNGEDVRVGKNGKLEKIEDFKAKKQSNSKFSQKEQLKKEIAHEVVKAEQNGNRAHAEAGKRELERLNKQNDYTFTKTGGNNYFTTERVDKDGDMVGKIETHDRDVKKPYYVAWKPKDENLKYSPNAKWETQSFDTKEEALNYLKEKQSNNKVMSRQEYEKKMNNDPQKGNYADTSYESYLDSMEDAGYDVSKARANEKIKNYVEKKKSNNKIKEEEMSWDAYDKSVKNSQKFLKEILSRNKKRKGK